MAMRFAELKAVEGDFDAERPYVAALAKAQKELAELRVFEQQQQCVLALQAEEGGGEAAALALDALKAAGVTPSRGCFHAALAACARADAPHSDSGAPEGEWALLLFDEAASAGAADATAASLALRACARSAAWGSASQVLAAAQAQQCVPEPLELEALLLCVAAAPPPPSRSRGAEAEEEAAEAPRLCREVAAELLSQCPGYFDDDEAAAAAAASAAAAAAAAAAVPVAEPSRARPFRQRRVSWAEAVVAGAVRCCSRRCGRARRR